MGFQELRRDLTACVGSSEEQPPITELAVRIARKVVRQTFFLPGRGKSPKRRLRSRLEEKPRARNIILQPQMAWSPFKPQKHGGQLVRRQSGQPLYKKAILWALGRLNCELRRLQSGAKRRGSEEKVLEVDGGTKFLHKHFGPQVA